MVYVVVIFIGLFYHALERGVWDPTAQSGVVGHQYGFFKA